MRHTFSVCQHTTSLKSHFRPLFPSPFGCFCLRIIPASYFDFKLLMESRFSPSKDWQGLWFTRLGGNIYWIIYKLMTASSQLCENCWKYRTIQKSYHKLKGRTPNPCKQWIISVRLLVGATYSNKSHHLPVSHGLKGLNKLKEGCRRGVVNTFRIRNR